MTDTTTTERIPEIFVADWKTEPGRNGMSQLDLFWELLDRWFDGDESKALEQWPDIDVTQTWILDRLKRYQDDCFEYRDAENAQKMEGKQVRQRAINFLAKLITFAQENGQQLLASEGLATYSKRNVDRLEVHETTEWLKSRLTGLGLTLPTRDEEQLAAEGMEITDENVADALVDEDSVETVATDF